MQNDLVNVYFEWMYQLVCNERRDGDLSYRKLLMQLHDIEFTYILDMDENRAVDGVDFRYRFAYENGYPRDLIEEHIDTRKCSVLEMMIALSFRIEEQIMDDYEYGNRTGQWFWNMIVSLGLGTMSDARIDMNHVEDKVSKFLSRDYNFDGSGGLFTIKDITNDMRDAEIWYQAMWYLDDNFDFSI